MLALLSEPLIDPLEGNVPQPKDVDDVKEID